MCIDAGSFPRHLRVLHPNAHKKIASIPPPHNHRTNGIIDLNRTVWVGVETGPATRARASVEADLAVAAARAAADAQVEVVEWVVRAQGVAAA